ncbi:PH domain-containing protein [Mangrovivirga sp. M17]|uniref:PH domain-containing protein n=1 Tax=Mangrovivirga halotolerans TaxID=2993936 RepID=A0ABT3RR37_9BACT|nr:PH domain-containing protein [Mangrovivirga halotolerans]MCX2743833.1 PH domain-containing protein [Mangrovivirga halotolerans]
MIWGLFKNSIKYYNEELNLLNGFFKNEYMIINGKAKYYDNYNNVSGELVLTNKRIIFVNDKVAVHSFLLPEITSVKCGKNPFKIKNRLTLKVNELEYKYSTNYPDDWESLIKHMIRVKNLK